MGWGSIASHGPLGSSGSDARTSGPGPRSPCRRRSPGSGRTSRNAAEHRTSSERSRSGKDRRSADWTRSRIPAPYSKPICEPDAVTISDTRGTPGGAAIAVSRASNSDTIWNASMSSGMVANDDVASSRSSSIDPVSGSCSSNRTAPLPFQARNAIGSPLNLSSICGGSFSTARTPPSRTTGTINETEPLVADPSTRNPQRPRSSSTTPGAASIQGRVACPYNLRCHATRSSGTRTCIAALTAERSSDGCMRKDTPSGAAPSARVSAARD